MAETRRTRRTGIAASIAGDVAAALVKHGLDEDETAAGMLLDRVRWLSALDREKASLSMKEITQVVALADRLSGYIGKRLRNRAVRDRAARTLHDALTLDYITRLAHAGITHIAAIHARIGHGTATVDDLQAIVAGLGRIEPKSQGRSETPLLPVLSAARGVWLSNGKPDDWRGRIEFIADLLIAVPMGMHVPPLGSARGANEPRLAWERKIRDHLAGIAAREPAAQR